MEIEELKIEFEKALDVLRELVDLQSGESPLYQYKDDYEKTMEEAYKLLEKYNK